VAHKKTAQTDSSLWLHEVLEEEFVVLHKASLPDYPSSTELVGNSGGRIDSARLKALWAAVHALPEKRAALCLSGGGIRSATFGLGILQGLARCGLLEKFHYLSTVSGGGYIGSWLSAWINRQDIKGVIAGLALPGRRKEPPMDTPQGNGGLVAESAESKRTPDATLDPEPQPIRHLRDFSNYLTPKTGLMSVDFWTLIATFVRNMFLNWLVLISWLAAAMMIPRLYLGVINLAPDWPRLATLHTSYLEDHHLQPDWATWAGSVKHQWDIGLTILLAVGFALIAVAMAYAIIDVPSTGDARFSQRRFLWFRQLPLLLASLILAAWWAVFRNVHGSEPLQSKALLQWFVGFTVTSYLSGGLLATAFLLFRKDGHKAAHNRLTDEIEEVRESSASLLRLATIVLTAVFAGFCLWAIAMRLFLFPSETDFVLNRDCETIQPANQGEKLWFQTPPYPSFKLPAGTKFVRTSGSAGTSLGENEFVLKQDCKAIEMPSGQKTTLPARTHVRFAGENLTALQPVLVPAPARHALNYVCFAPALLLLVLLLVNFLFTGLASRITKDEDREWWGRSAAWILITVFAWIVFNVLDLWGAQAVGPGEGGNQLQVFIQGPQATEFGKAIFGAFGGVTGIVAALLALRHKLSNKLGQKGSFQWLLVAVAILFFVLLSIVISCVIVVIRSRPGMQSAAQWFSNESGANSLSWPSWRIELFVAFFLTAVLLFFGIAMGFFIDANSFSLHATYRNRLIRAYLAASRIKGTRKPRKPNPFTGFDPDDDFELHKLSPGNQKLFHVINATLNLIKGRELAWQERQAESFTMSPLHCGSSRVGYRPSTEYGGGITLGTAFAISGAAANPNMGYHSSPVVRFLMTLFNVRLGWWLGNPGPAGDKTWRRCGPRYSVGPLFSEAMGNTTDTYKYVNLSDGGHFENLGLYEMVLRRCHFILVSDAGEDPECSFADLGEAVRKIRIDFGIPIEFGPMTIFPRSQIDSLKKRGKRRNNCAIGRICYSAVDPDVNGKKAPDGIIIYIKPACYGEEPRDIYEYFKRSETFPHESTTDQFFSESQFESYRMLGAYTVEKLCTDCHGDFRSFVNVIFGSHLQTEVPKWLKELIRPIPNASDAAGAA